MQSDEQLNWHKEGKQGCMFAKLLAKKFDSKNDFWKRTILENNISKELIFKIKSEVDSCVKNPDNQILSIVIPSILKEDDLINFLKTLKTNYPDIHFESDDSAVDNHTLISVRVPSIFENDKSFWILGFGNFEFFPKTRRSPLFEIVLPTKTKEYLFKTHNRFSHYQPTKESYNRKGDLASAHLADIEIPNITNNSKKDNKLWEGTRNLKEAILNELYKDPRSKAKNSFTLKGWHTF